MKLTLEFEFDEDTQYIVVTCPELGISSFGKTLSDAFEMIGDAGAVYLGTLEDLGELEERVLGVVERIDADPEEIEQDIRDAIKATRDCRPSETVVEMHERMIKEGKMPPDSYIAFDN